MSSFIPTTTITVERNTSPPVTGTEVQGYESLPENWTPTATGAPADLNEDDQRTWDPSADRMTVREVTRLRARPQLDLQDRDRITDERTGVVYQVDTITTPSSVTHAADIRATLIRLAN